MIKLFEKKNCCFYCINFLENKSILYCNAINSVLSRNFCLKNRCKKYVQKDFTPIEKEDNQKVLITKNKQPEFLF